MVGERQKNENLSRGEAKSQWERPTLAYLGKVGDLVRGQGKTGSTGDADPAQTAKSGTG